jgi:hypothetical protein
MKNRKFIFRFAVILIAVISTVCACNQKPQNNEEENDFRLTPAEDGKSLAIIRYNGKKQGVSIPARIYQFPVTNIGKNAFYEKDLISVTIPNTVTVIGDGAFAENKLINASIGSGVTVIGDGAFGENQLTSVSIPSNVTMIGAMAFYKNRLTAVTIPNNVTVIGDNAFGGNKLTTVTIPANVSSIGNSPFINCSELTTINVNNNNKNYSSADGVLYNKDRTELIQWPSGKTGDAAIPYGVITIKNNAFSGGQLTNVTIPDSVTSIEQGAFMDNQLTSVVIGSGVTSIGDYAFQNNQLSEVTIPNGVTSIGIGSFLKNQITSITIGENVTLDSNYYNPSFGFSFEYYYRNTGRKAGTYTRPNVNSYDWSKKN